MSTDGLTPPGTATYSSSILNVGDGTWDTSRNDFLLPNLQGFGLAVTQYNGMGNRFKGEPQYHVLITGHAVVAAITFIGLVPTAIFIARFYTANPRVALKLHVYLQILTVFLATVVLILGWFAVGPERSLTNPHHQIGVAIYTLVLVQFLYGWLMFRLERRRKGRHPTLPLKVFIHKILGRSIAVLAFVQIALGLTLYGSPKALFILYALVGFFLLFLYLTLVYVTLPAEGVDDHRPPASDYYSDYDGNYVSGQQTDLTQTTARREDRHHWGRDLLGAAGVVGAYEWWKRGRNRKQADQDHYTGGRRSPRQRPPRQPEPPSTYGPSGVSGGGVDASALTYSRPPSRGSRYSRGETRTDLSPRSSTLEDEDEKFANRPKQHTWRNRLLEAGAGVAAFEGIKGIFNRNRRQDNRAQSQGRYRHPAGGNQSAVSQSEISRVEAGQAPFSPGDARRQQRFPESDVTPVTPSRPPRRRQSSVGDSQWYDDQDSFTTTPRPHNTADRTLRDSIATLGAIAGFREWSKRRRERKEEQRAERIRQQELETEEQFNRRNSDRYPRPQDATGRRDSLTGTIMTGPDPAAGSSQQFSSSRQNIRPDTSQPPLPAMAGVLPSASGPLASTVGPSVSRQNVAAPQQYNIPPPPIGQLPSSLRPGGYHVPESASVQMPQGAVDPDPSRLLSESARMQGSPSRPGESVAAAGGFAASQYTQSQSPSRLRSREDSRVRFQQPEASSVSALQSTSGGPGGSGSGIINPVSLKVKMHNDGRHVTLRRLSEEEAAAERAARRQDRRQQRRNSSFSSVGGGQSGNGGPPQQRHRRNSNIRPSSVQPITNVPIPPAMSNSAFSSQPPSDLRIPESGMAQRFNQAAQTGSSPPPASAMQNLSALQSAAMPAGTMAGSPGDGQGGQAGTDIGTGTDISAFDENRRRRRAERARRAAAQAGGRVEFS